MGSEWLAVPIVAILFIGMPWMILHYVSKWKSSTPVLTGEDEKLLDEMYNFARRLEERLVTVERIVAADHPDYRPLSAPQEEPSRYDPSVRYDPSRRN